jgi:hypothetical protein
MEHKLLNIVEDSVTFLDSGKDGCEVVIGQYDVECFLD